MKIRRATLQDCEVICEIHISSIRELGKSHYSEDQIASWSRGRTPERYEKFVKGKYVLVAEVNSNSVGFGTFDLETGELIQLYVRPEFAGRCVGKRILSEFLDLAKTKELKTVYCDASLNAEKFYIGAGFAPGPKCKHQFGDGNSMDCIPMKKTLR